MDMFWEIIGCIFAFCLFCLYFLPTLIAHERKHNAFLGILIVNCFFGWSIVGWIICLVWAYGVNTQENYPKKY